MAVCDIATKERSTWLATNIWFDHNVNGLAKMEAAAAWMLMI